MSIYRQNDLGSLLLVKDTCTGFLLGGIGEINAKRQKNFLVVTKGKKFLFDCWELCLLTRLKKRVSLRHKSDLVGGANCILLQSQELATRMRQSYN